MRKSITVLVAILLVCSLGMSCSGQQEPAVQESDQTVQATEPAAPAAPAKKQSTLEMIRDRGYVVAGVNSSNPGFSFLQEDGSYKGFEVELAKA